VTVPLFPAFSSCTGTEQVAFVDVACAEVLDRTNTIGDIHRPHERNMPIRHGNTHRHPNCPARHHCKRSSSTPAAWMLASGLLIVAGCGIVTSPKSPASQAVTRPIGFDASAVTQPADHELVTQRYDVSELLRVPTDYTQVPDLSQQQVSQGTPDPTGNGLFNPVSPPPAPNRAARVEELKKYIMENADPGTWIDDGGATGRISSSPMRGILLITHTAATQTKIRALLDDLCNSRGKQLTVEVRLLYLDESMEKQLPGDLRSRLALVRNAGLYRRDEFLTDEQVAICDDAINGPVHENSLPPPRLTLFSGQRSVRVVQTQQAYVADLKKVTDAANNPQHPWLYDPQIKTTMAEGFVLHIVACPSPDNASAFVDLDCTCTRLMGLIPEKFGRDPLPGGVEGTVQHPVHVTYRLLTSKSLKRGGQPRALKTGA